MNRHWDSFADEFAWFVDGREVAVGPLQPPGNWRATPAVTERFPRLSTLLSRAHVTNLSIDGEPHVLFSWQLRTGDVRAWLAKPPEPDPAPELFADHRLLLRAFGGVVERSNEPEDSWLLNLNDALTAGEAAHDASFVADYSWPFERDGVPIPIDLQAYYSIAREANGNDTLCHRVQGDVLLFAPDHSFSHVVPLAGCPEYTLYRIPTAPSFSAWVEAVAGQWSD